MKPRRSTRVSEGEKECDHIDDVESIVRRRMPRRLSTARNHVYITMKTHIAAQLKRIHKLLDGGEFEEVVVHGLGNAIPRTINVCLNVRTAALGSVDCKVTDDIISLLDDDQSPAVRQRNTSAVHVTLFRPVIPIVLPK